MTEPTPPRRDDTRPGRSADDIVDAIETELTRGDRRRYLVVLAASLAVVGLVGTLWATEPSLPLRTHLAFAAIVVLGTAWLILSVYVLTRRRPLYAADRVLATGMAVAVTAIVGSAAVTVAALRGDGVTVASVTAIAVTFVGVAVALHVRARAYRRALLERRRRLERTAGA